MKKLWVRLIGDEGEFDYRERRLHTIVWAISIMLFAFVPFNAAIGMTEQAIAMALTAGFLLKAWAISRYFRMFTLALSSVFTILMIALMFTFYYNGGVQGPTLLFFLICFVASLTVLSTQQMWYSMIAHLVVATALLAYQYYNQDLFPNRYPSMEMWIIDMGISFFSAVVIYSVVYWYVKGQENAQAKLLEEENQYNLMLREQLEELNAEKDKLFSVLAHDMRSPLASVEGALELMATDELTEEEKNQLYREMLRLVRNSSFMVENVLHWSRHGSLTNGESQVTFFLEDLFSQIEGMTLPMAQSKGVNLNVQCVPGLRLKMHKTALEVILRNAVHNAVKFTPKNRNVEVFTRKHQGVWQVVIDDEGSGLDPELWNATEVQSTPGTNGESGSGLGLTLMKNFSEKIDVQVEVSNPMDGGTRMIFTLPPASLN